MIDEDTRSYVQSIVEAAPQRVGDLDAVVAHGQRRKRVTRIGTVAAVMVAVVVTVGSLTWLRPQPQPVASGDQPLELELPGGFVVSVAPSPVELEGALVYLGLLGPEPRFDRTTLGTEIMLTRRSASELVVPPAGNPLEQNALQASTMVYLGDLNGAQIALQVNKGWLFGILTDAQLCVFWGNGTPVTGGGDCSVSDGPISTATTDPPIGGLLVWAQLPEDTSAVRLELPDGSSYWQRPTARTVFFNLPDGRSLANTHLSALDADGKLLRTRRSTDTEP